MSNNAEREDRSPALNSISQGTANHMNGGADRDRTDDLKLAKLALSQLSYGPDLFWLCHPQGRLPLVARRLGRDMVGQGRFELPTSRLSSARSNQLSY